MHPRRVRRNGDRFASMVLLIDSTGSGKRFFINKLKEGATVESDSLYSCRYSPSSEEFLPCNGLKFAHEESRYCNLPNYTNTNWSHKCRISRLSRLQRYEEKRHGGPR